MIIQNYNLNLVPGEPVKVVDVSQYDADSRNIVFALFSGREKFNVPESATVTCDGTKRDNKGFSHDCTFLDNKVTLVPTEDMTAVGGDVVCQLTIEDNGKILGTANFILRVERAALGDGTDMSPSDIAEAYDIFKKAKEAVENANTATDKTNKATEAANNAADLATEVAEHPNIPKNGTWWKWDTESDAYVDTHERAVLGIDKTYPSYDDMEADKGNRSENTVAIIQSNVEDENNAKLYIHDGSDWVYLADLSGFTGVGIEKIELTEGDHSPGTSDTYTITMDNGETSTFTVWNGETGPVGEKGETGDVWVPSVDDEGNLTWEKNSEITPEPANITGPVGPEGPEGKEGPVGPQGEPGVSPTVDVVKDGGVTTVTITDAQGLHTATINDGDVSREALDAALAEKQDKLTFDEVPTEGSENPVKSGGVWDGLQRKPNRNLLDNWYFVGGGSQQGNGQLPINQRAQIEYPSNNGYSIDRWLFAQTGTMTVEKDGVKFTCGTCGFYFYQFAENYESFKGKQLTFSVLCTGTGDANKNIFLQLNAGDGGRADSGFTDPGSNAGVFSVTLTVGENPSQLLSIITTESTSGSITLIAAKLELGSHQTLAHKEGGTWVLNEIPNYAEELAKCQRYQLVLLDGGEWYSAAVNYLSGAAFIPTPVTMRANPTISKFNYLADKFGALYINKDSLKVSEILTTGAVCNNGVSVAIIPENKTYGGTASWGQIGLLLDANL